jgi:hypothetical protein
MAINIKPTSSVKPVNFEKRRTAVPIGNPDYHSARNMTESFSNLTPAQKSGLAHMIDKEGTVTGAKMNQVIDKALEQGMINSRKAKDLKKNLGIPKYW